jgi:hypothetical protein
MEIIDLEDYSLKGEKPPKGHKYQFRVNNEKFVTDKECLTGREILEIAGKKPPESYKLTQIFHKGEKKIIGLDDKVDLTEAGIERFHAQKRDVQDGLLRQEFILPNADIEFLNSNFGQWETIRFSNSQWLIIYDFEVPEGYNQKKVDIALRIDSSYPVSQIDMAYFYPHLERADKKSINGLTPLSLENKQWQQWSRHRTGENPWLPNEDNVSTHLDLVYHFLTAELKR